MLAALTAAESHDDLEAAQQLLRLGDVNARSRQVLYDKHMLAPTNGFPGVVTDLLNIKGLAVLYEVLLL